MSSSIDKRYGDMFIHGKHHDGRVDVIISAHGFELDLGLIDAEKADKLMVRWNELKDEIQRLAEYEWMYKGLSE